MTSDSVHEPGEHELSAIINAIVASQCDVEMQIVQLDTQKWHVYIKLEDGARSFISKPYADEADATAKAQKIMRQISARRGQQPTTSYGGGN